MLLILFYYKIYYFCLKNILDFSLKLKYNKNEQQEIILNHKLPCMMLQHLYLIF